MKFLLDVNFSPKWIALLAANGLDAVHWASLGPSNSPDTSIMSFASTHDYIILTNDLDFGNILAATNAAKPSVIQLRIDENGPELGLPLVLASIFTYKESLTRGVLVTIQPNKTRASLLPLRRSEN